MSERVMSTVLNNAVAKTEAAPSTAARAVPVKIRPARSEDAGMIVSSWVKNYGRSRAALALDQKVYFAEQTRLVDRLIREGAVLVAVNPDDDGQILGWICVAYDSADALTIHYAYVKRTFRRFGIATKLLEAVGADNWKRPVFFTHVPKTSPSDPECFADMPSLVAKLAPTATYNPYRLWSGR